MCVRKGGGGGETEEVGSFARSFCFLRELFQVPVALPTSTIT